MPTDAEVARRERRSGADEECRQQRKQGNRLQDDPVSHPVLAVERAVLALVDHRQDPKGKRGKRGDGRHNEQ